MSINNFKVITIVTTMIVLGLLVAGCGVPAPGSEAIVAAAGDSVPAAPIAVGATELAGSGPDHPLMPTTDWMQIHEGEYLWYAFHYDFDEDFAPVEIRMYSEPEDGAVLTIRNAEQAEKWRADGTQEHIGCCVVQDLGNDEETDYAVWSGDLFSSGTYYIVIEHAKHLTGPVSYRFEFAKAEGVSMPAGLYAPVAESPPPAPIPELKMAEAALVVEGVDSGPDFPMMPTGEWMALEQSQMHWFAFDYDFDEDFAALEVRMYTEPEDSAILTIRNAEQAEKWRVDGTNEHIGCCTVQDLGDEETDYAVWSGELFSSGRYYIVIEHAKNMSETAYYRFEFVASEGVSFPQGLIDPQRTEPVPAAEPVAEVAAAPEPMKLLGMNGSGPDFALVPTGEWTELGEDLYHWYAFKYDFDEDHNPIEIRIYTNPEDGAVLTIRNAEQAEKWRVDGTHEHLGCCTVQDLGDEETDYAVWSGTLGSSGTYYIVVEHAENMNGPVHYMFTIEGEGISY
ncbi:hypothetical protein KFU94_66130 [Chloroflexi bacterium TSY]|nr:hypothetical protein [Chloroflexi bacterium TSY]